ncbi:hypothetical protein [Propionivibrio sp.]|uniref:hypothetical protein n=1 Tax=Propionivibrio sp. TaxID=2212460 RepID=UPI0025EED1F7|nr:hypothetical protein [Propionivibrio sp.]MBK7355144.1 hypothetical protein [Propionivibrio sp.]
MLNGAATAAPFRSGVQKHGNIFFAAIVLPALNAHGHPTTFLPLQFMILASLIRSIALFATPPLLRRSARQGGAESGRTFNRPGFLTFGKRFVVAFAEVQGQRFGWNFHFQLPSYCFPANYSRSVVEVSALVRNS